MESPRFCLLCCAAPKGIALCDQAFQGKPEAKFEENGYSTIPIYPLEIFKQNRRSFADDAKLSCLLLCQATGSNKQQCSLGSCPPTPSTHPGEVRKQQQQKGRGVADLPPSDLIRSARHPSLFHKPPGNRNRRLSLDASFSPKSDRFACESFLWIQRCEEEFPLGSTVVDQNPGASFTDTPKQLVIFQNKPTSCGNILFRKKRSTESSKLIQLRRRRRKPKLVCRGK